MVSVTMILVAVLFVMVVGIGGTSKTPQVMILTKNTVPNGVRIQLTDATAEVKWGEVMIQLSNGAVTDSWNNLTTDDLYGTTMPLVWHYGSAMALGNLSVFLNITDLSGNGKISRGDWLTFTTFTSPSFDIRTTYTLTLIYAPTGGSMMTADIL